MRRSTNSEAGAALGLTLSLVIAGTLLPATGSAQSIASRVAAVRDGSIQMTIPSRSGVCGDDDKILAYRKTIYIWPSIESHGTWSGVNCAPGPLRVKLTLARGDITTIRTRAGEGKRSPSGARVDLGVVSAQEAAEYFLTLASRLEGKASRDALVPAALAEAVNLMPALLRIARDTGRPRETRGQAIRWIGELGEEGAVTVLNALATDIRNDMPMREHALMGLAFVPDGEGVPSLISVARSSNDPELRKKGIFWLSQADDPAARQTLRDMASSDATPEEVREQVVFALGHHNQTAEEGAFLRALYGRATSESLKEKIIQSVAQAEKQDDTGGGQWLLKLAHDDGEPMELRKKALFWAGQSEDTPVEDLISSYGAMKNPTLKEHFVFVLSERDEHQATDKLMDIARNDPDQSIRKKALFWLGQKDDDTRITQFLKQLILKP